jgi:PAS domain S-box-containing protein
MSDPRFSYLIFDRIPHGIFTVDEQGRVTSFNAAAERITGWSQQEVTGRYCREILQADHCQEACFLRESIREDEEFRDQEVMIKRRDGRQILVSVSTASLKDLSGKLIGGVEMLRDLSMLAHLRRELKGSYTCEDIVTKSPAMRGVIEMLPLVAKSTSTVLVEGEPGTGKELVARAIHNLGSRRDRPFVPVNCGALPDTLAESELFGYKKGAFTDAHRDKPGRFALAEGGTIFLDEVAEISPAMQVKLLRVLQERQYTPLGAVEPSVADVRVLAATNKELSEEARRGRFRQDLFYRLNVVRINLPPLRARSEDIPLLVDHFIAKFNALQGRRIQGISERAMAILMNYDYPGNVRELENAVEHAFVICGGAVIGRDELPPHIRGERLEPLSGAGVRGWVSRGVSSGGDSASPGAEDDRKIGPLQDAEARAIREALDQHNGHRGKAAKELGISRNTLWRKMKRHGVE